MSYSDIRHHTNNAWQVCVLRLPEKDVYVTDIVMVTARSCHARHRLLPQEAAQTHAGVQTFYSKPRQLYLNV